MKKYLQSDSGAVTAEYVIATMAAVGFATLLLVILKSDEVRQILLGMVKQALEVKL
ncbi:MAG: hypothetical protein RLZ69_320 [Actinomycetota bacterium]|jgi:hypothetical protein